MLNSMWFKGILDLKGHCNNVAKYIYIIKVAKLYVIS